MKTSCPYDLIIGLDRSDAKATSTTSMSPHSKTLSQTLDTAPEAAARLAGPGAQTVSAAAGGRLCRTTGDQPHRVPEAYSWIDPHAITPITLQKYRRAFRDQRRQGARQGRAGFLA